MSLYALCLFKDKLPSRYSEPPSGNVTAISNPTGTYWFVFAPLLP